jgi:hypothetical protein
MSVKQYRTRSHEANVSVCHHADEWLLAPQTQDRCARVLLCDQLNWSYDHGTRPHCPADAGRVAGPVMGAARDGA